jgi:mRNA interferase YafQ
MRTIDWANAFKKDFRRVKANPHHAHDIDHLLSVIVDLLAEDKPLPESYRDHALLHNWKGYRECHVKPDLLMIYKTEVPEILRLARLGTHSELFNR